MALTDQPTTVPTPSHRTPSASRRLGYSIAVVVNFALAFVVNVWPGWQTVSWLTPDATTVVGLVNVSLLVGIGVNLVCMVFDPPWFRSLGDLVTTAVGLAVVVRLYAVFPFDFSAYAFPWDSVARAVLILAIIGSLIGVIVNVVQLVVRVVGAASASSALD